MYNEGRGIMNTLYETIEQLCETQNINATRLCKSIGISRGILTDLKMGRKKMLAAETLSKIAAYFGVSVEYLMSGGQTETPGATSGPAIGMDDFTYAMHNESKKLTAADKELLLRMARQLNEARQARRKSNGGTDQTV